MMVNKWSQITPALCSLLVSIWILSFSTKMAVLGQDDDDDDDEFTEEHESLWQVTDPSCNTSYEDHTKSLRNIWEFDNNTEARDMADLYEKDYRFPSYVAYPCNMRLYEKYKTEFLLKFMECPFKKDLNKKFKRFVKDELWALKQTNSTPDKVEDSSLLYQYICFSQQLEECVPDPTRQQAAGACDGVCQCIVDFPIKRDQLPKGLDPDITFPKLVLELDVRCGVESGRACWATWSPTCFWESDEDVMKKYAPEDLYFQCETLAQCHRETKICECARGHSCTPDLLAAGAEGRINNAWGVLGGLLIGLILIR